MKEPLKLHLARVERQHREDLEAGYGTVWMPPALGRKYPSAERINGRGKAVNMASHFVLDDVIDPAESRQWIAAGLRSLPPTPTREGKKRPNVDTW